MKNIIKSIDTDHKFINYLKSLNMLVLPQIVTIQNDNNMLLQLMNFDTDVIQEKKNPCVDGNQIPIKTIFRM